ncbi:hypothetical protein M9H77_13720 [Catharanthus roseus]|uniref:Uncharacterized protein n=1 Tax=Catharanthus roseus TaxID=4058 RepID=A0ACC0BL67_CATRO|nr:hypothetical protein M9H77_13720 [Catharanthus roseus]
MADKKLSATIFILSLLLLATFSNACGSCEQIKPKPNSSPKAPPVNPFCPRDTLKLGACVNVLGLVNVVVGTPPYGDCCAVLEGLADLEAAACLCTAIKAGVLGINLTVPVALSALVSACGRTIPPGFQCG